LNGSNNKEWDKEEAKSAVYVRGPGYGIRNASDPRFEDRRIRRKCKYDGSKASGKKCHNSSSTKDSSGENQLAGYECNC
jgi:hypothetical protein